MTDNSAQNVSEMVALRHSENWMVFPQTKVKILEVILIYKLLHLTPNISKILHLLRLSLTTGEEITNANPTDINVNDKSSNLDVMSSCG